MTNASTFNITFFPTISTVDFHKRLVLLIVLCCLTSYAPSLFAEDVNKIAAMEATLKTAKEDTSKVRLLGDLAWEYQNADIDKAMAYAKEELALAKKIKNDKFLGLAYNDMGIAYFKLGDWPNALKYNEQSYAIRKKSGDEMDIASSLNKISSLKYKMSMYEEALPDMLECLRIYEKHHEKKYIAYTAANISQVHLDLHQYDKSRQYTEMAMKINKEIADTNGLVMNYINLASNLLATQKIDSCIEMDQTSLRFLNSSNNLYTKAIVYNNLAVAHERKGLEKECIENYKLAIEYARSTQNKSGIANYCNNLGNVLIKFNKIKEAFPYLQESWEVATEINQRKTRENAAENLSMFYWKTGEYKQAYIYLNAAAQLRDTIFGEETSRAVAEMQAKYETTKKEKDNQILTKNNQIQALTIKESNLKISRRNTLMMAMSIAMFLGLITFYLIYSRNKLKQQLSMEAALLKQQELRAKAVLEAEELERQRIGKDLHDGIGQMLSAVKLNMAGLEKQLNSSEHTGADMLHNAMSLLDESVKEIRTISHTMMPNVLISSGLVKAVRSFVDSLAASGELKIDLHISGLDQRMDSGIETVLYRVLQEIVNNIIKHAKASNISIQLLRFENEITLMIEDNGIGFNVEEVLAKEGGLGLKNIISRVEYLKGKVHFDSHPGRGTTVSIEIPIA